MAARRLSKSLLPAIRRIFYKANPPVSPEEAMWRERAARLTLDALGHTNLTRKAHEHNAAVIYARRWFRGMYDDPQNSEKVDNSRATFECAGLDMHFEAVREVVLSRHIPRMRDTRKTIP
jgi:hypothetical protein